MNGNSLFEIYKTTPVHLYNSTYNKMRGTIIWDISMWQKKQKRQNVGIKFFYWHSNFKINYSKFNISHTIGWMFLKPPWRTPIHQKILSSIKNICAWGEGGHGLRDHKVTKQTNYLPSSLINLYLKVLKKCSFVLFEQYVKEKGISKFGGAKCLDFSKKFKELVLFLELAVSLDRGFQTVL